MGESFVAPLDAIDDQMQYVEGVRDKARTADDAAGQVRTQNFDLAFGVLCQAFPTAIRPVEEQTVDTIKRIVEALQHTSDNLKDTGKSYRNAEKSIVDSFEELQDELDGPQGGGTDPAPGVPAPGVPAPERDAPVDPMPRVPPNVDSVPMPQVPAGDDGTVYA